MREASVAAEAAFNSADTAFAGVSALVDQRSPIVGEAVSALRSLSAAGRSLRELADYLERHPEALLKGKR
jgi:paraquat-inducible protein B